MRKSAENITGDERSDSIGSTYSLLLLLFFFYIYYNNITYFFYIYYICYIFYISERIVCFEYIRSAPPSPPLNVKMFTTAGIISMIMLM